MPSNAHGLIRRPWRIVSPLGRLLSSEQQTIGSMPRSSTRSWSDARRSCEHVCPGVGQLVGGRGPNKLKPHCRMRTNLLHSSTFAVLGCFRNLCNRLRASVIQQGASTSLPNTFTHRRISAFFSSIYTALCFLLLFLFSNYYESWL